MIPIGPALADQLRRQEELPRRAYGAEGTEFLLPSPRQAGRQGTGLGGGHHHVSPRSVGQLRQGYVRKADIRDSDGELASWVHPHLFRHHLGTSLVNDGVPLPVIQRVLDHASIADDRRYAQIHDETRPARDARAGRSGSTSVASGSRCPSTGRSRRRRG